MNHLFPLVILLILLCSPLYADTQEPGITVIGLQYENDVFVGQGQDRWFTNGFKLDWATTRRPSPRWMKALADAMPGFTTDEYAPWGWSIQQRMFTPDNITDPLPPLRIGLTQVGSMAVSPSASSAITR